MGWYTTRSAAKQAVEEARVRAVEEFRAARLRIGMLDNVRCFLDAAVVTREGWVVSVQAEVERGIVSACFVRQGARDYSLVWTLGADGAMRIDVTGDQRMPQGWEAGIERAGMRVQDWMYYVDEHVGCLEREEAETDGGGREEA